MTAEHLYSLIERIGNLIRTETRKIGGDLGLQPVHLQTLHYLARCNRYSDTSAAVTDYLGATKGTVSQTLKVLERKGYVLRQTDTRDKRIQHLKITGAGNKVLSVMLPPTNFRAASEQLRESESMMQMIQLLTQLLRQLQTSNQSKPFGVCNSCCFFLAKGSVYQCGLTQELLSFEDSEKICWEHTAK